MLSIMVCPPGFLCSQGLARDPQRSATLCPRGFYCPGGGIVSQGVTHTAKDDFCLIGMVCFLNT